MEAIRTILQNENGFEEIFLEHDIINIYNDIYENNELTPSMFSSIVLTLASLVDFSDESAKFIYDIFPYEKVYERAISFFNTKTNELEKDAIGSTLQYASLLVLKDVEISPDEFDLMLDTLLRNYEIWNEDYFKCFICSFPYFIQKWPIQNIPLDRMEEVGVPGILEHIISCCEKDNELFGEMGYILDGLTLLLDEDYYMKGINATTLWDFLISSDSSLQQSAFNFWIKFAQKPSEQWPEEVLNMDNVKILIEEFTINFDSKIKLIAIDFASTFILSLSESDAYTFVFDGDINLYTFFITCAPLSESTVRRLKAIKKLVSLYDVITTSKKPEYIDMIYETDKDELEELVESDNETISSLAQLIIEIIDSYSI